MGNTLFSMAVYWYVLSATQSRADLGYVGSILSLAGLVGLVSGALVDRWNRRRTMIVSDAVRVALSLVLLVAALGHHMPVAFLVATVLVMAVVGTVFTPAASALVPSIVVPDQLVGANGMMQSAAATAQLAGASFGGVLLGIFGPVVLFGFNGASFAVSVSSLMLLRVVAAPRTPSGRLALAQAGRRLWTDVAEGQRLIWTSPWMRRSVPISLVVNFAAAPLNFMDVAWVRQVLHRGAVVYGLFGASVLVGMIAGSLSASAVTRRVPLNALLGTGLAMGGLCIVSVSLLPRVAPNLAALFLFGLFAGVLTTAVPAAMQRHIPDRLLGRVFGTSAALATAAVPLGALLAGLAAAVLPLQTVFLSAGLLMALASLLAVGMPETFRLDERAVAGL